VKRLPVRPLAAALAAGGLAGITGLLIWLAAGNLDPPGQNKADGLRGTVYLALGIASEESFDRELRERSTEEVERFSKAFRALHPGVSIQLVAFPEAELVAQLPRRQQAGLGPDLLLITAAAAMRLQRQGQVHPLSMPAETLNQLEPETLARLRLPDGRLAALPVAQQPELACFNRKRLPEGSPTDLAGILRRSSEGVRFGLSIDPHQLFWTLGGLGAGDALLKASRGTPLSDAERRQLVLWLGWLQNASFQQHITFFATQDELLHGLRRGQLDWISCRSSSISRLEKQLGADLGVAALPGGAQGAATPVNRLRVLAFGANSSPGQRRIAMEMARFSVNPLVQRNLTLESQDLLPVNRFVPAPTASSAVLKSMVVSAEQALAAHPLVLALVANPAVDQALSAVLAKVIFGDQDPRGAVDTLIHDLQPPPR
jgi:arabinogalactan oligomer/maltooligosaccharide transport system substrate-binding protein